jgi:predicted nucleic acid-binding protein
LIFVDANVPMYLIGGAHPNKHEAYSVLERLALERRRLVTSSEVFQEMLHRYVSIERRDAIEPAFEALEGVVDDVFGVERRDAFAAKDLIHAHPRLSARDALHVAVMRRHEIAEIFSFDSGFDVLAGITRLSSAA